MPWVMSTIATSGAGAPDHAVADANELVVQPVVGEEGDDQGRRGVVQEHVDQAVDVVALGLDVDRRGRARVRSRWTPGRWIPRVRRREASAPAWRGRSGPLRGGGEGDVSRRARAAAGRSWSSGSATVSSRARTSTSAAALAERVGEDIAGLGRAGDEHAATVARDVLERLDERLGDDMRGTRAAGMRAASAAAVPSQSRRRSRRRTRARRGPGRERVDEQLGAVRAGGADRCVLVQLSLAAARPRRRPRAARSGSRAPRPPRRRARSASPPARSPAPARA